MSLTRTVAARSAGLTILLPTRNRPEFALRALRFYAEQGCEAQVIVADSSDTAPMEAAGFGLVSIPRPRYLDYRRYPAETSFVEKVTDALSTVDTPYVVLAADDDFFIPAALDEAVSYLQANPDYSVAHGEAIGFYLHGEAAAGPIVRTDDYPQRSIEHPTAAGRVESHFARYTTNWYSVQRTDGFRARWQAVVDQRPDYFFLELILTGLAVAEGRAKKLDRLYMARQGTVSKEYPRLTIPEWIELPEWLDGYERFRASLAGAIAARDGIARETAERAVDRAFHLYLSPYHPMGRWLPGARVSPLERLRGVVRRSRNFQRVDGRLYRLRQQLGPMRMAALRSPSSPHHREFAAVAAAVARGGS